MPCIRASEFDKGKSPDVETIGFGFLGFLILSPGSDILDAKKKAPHAKGQLVRLRGVEESESFFDEMSIARIGGGWNPFSLLTSEMESAQLRRCR
jgi:hypothetical protein